MIRAKSINPKAERMARRAAKKQLKLEYQQMKNKFWSRFFGCFIGIIISFAVGIITLMPFGHIAEVMNKDGDKPYLEKGFEYTLNGVLPDSVFDWAIHNKEEVVEDESVDEEISEEEPGVVIPGNGAEA